MQLEKSQGALSLNFVFCLDEPTDLNLKLVRSPLLVAACTPKMQPKPDPDNKTRQTGRLVVVVV